MSTETRPAALRLWTVELRYGADKMTDAVTAPTAAAAIEKLTAVLALSPEDVLSASASASAL